MFDVFGESCYQRYQGDPNSTSITKDGWTKTFAALAQQFPKLRFVAAEYGPMQREINDVLFGLPSMQGRWHLQLGADPARGLEYGARAF